MKERKGESNGQDSLPGTPSDPPSGVALPEKKTLELILDKLQKKDTYGVYAEPVDPEELPDYHDVIEHPMDFSTVRKKLRNESYSTLEQFESDVFLICSNAMQYNAPDTIYYKQARSIQELAKKKFEKLRIGVERSEKDSKIEQITKSNFLAKKQTKKPVYRTTQEPVGSDFSSGATLVTAGDVQNSSITIQANACERPSHADVLVEGNSSLADYNIEKTEELSSGKGLLSKLGKKSSTLDDNRRATYNISNQPVARSESIFTTFEAEIKQLVAVGLQAEFSYARSLARFAATLGPVAWKVASRRIEQALPMGCKFGRGWVGEYEPLPTPVLTLESRAPKESALFTKLKRAADIRKDGATYKTLVPAIDVRKDAATCKTPVPAKQASSAAAAAARAWMSIGAGGFKQATENSGTLKGQISAESLYNPARELDPLVSRVRGELPISARMQFQSLPGKDSFPLHAFASQPVRLVNETQFQNRPMVFPQLVTTDLSSFQVPSPRQGLSPRTQPRQKQDNLPPDLNIGFQSPGKESSGVLVDSQQPELALQL
ncbi:hypothetical protein CRYUN_Cryun25bG0012900 [Craigia yunnanensis]